MEDGLRGAVERILARWLTCPCAVSAMQPNSEPGTIPQLGEGPKMRNIS